VEWNFAQLLDSHFHGNDETGLRRPKGLAMTENKSITSYPDLLEANRGSSTLVGTSYYFLSPISYLLHLIFYLLHLISHLLRLISYLLHLTSSTPFLISYWLRTMNSELQPVRPPYLPPQTPFSVIHPAINRFPPNLLLFWLFLDHPISFEFHP